jgi:cutinase
MQPRRRRAVLGVLVALAAAALVPPAPASAVATTAACPTYELVGLRGQTEPAGYGWVLGQIVTTVVAKTTVPVKAVPLAYDANADTVVGVNSGITNLVAYVEGRAKACRSTRFVLLGFSMGAYVIGETLSTAPRYPGVVTTRFTTATSGRIAAVVVYGDGGFNGSSAPLAAGSYTPGVSGRLPRPVSALSAWNSRMRDVCNADDVICQSTGTSAAAHQDYVKYADATASWVNGVLTTLR